MSIGNKCLDKHFVNSKNIVYLYPKFSIKSMQSFLYNLPDYQFVILAGVVSFLVSYLTIPRIISVVKIKKLMDNPNHRSSHKEVTPTMGGIAFFASIIFGLFFIAPYDTDNITTAVAVGSVILFYIGIKDDLVGVAPMTKIGGQILSIVFVMTSLGFCKNALFGSFGTFETPLWLFYFIGICLTVAVVNAYNLIDGINGLASMVGIVIFAIFGYIFTHTNQHYYAVLSVVGIGFLLAFLRYNVSRENQRRIFMGDTGSMIVGFLISVCSLKFLNTNFADYQSIEIQNENKILLLIAILFIPFIDTLRVSIIRIMKKVSPFFADRNHTHHVIIDYTKLTHFQTSTVLAVTNLLAFLGIYFLNLYVSPWILGVFILALFIGGTLLLFYFNRSYAVRKKKHKVQKMIDKVIKNHSKRRG